jgi:hypothetical protein
LGEHRGEIVNIDDLDDSFNLMTWREPQPNVDYGPEQSVSADGRTKYFGVLSPAAPAHHAVRPHNRECDDVTNEWRECKPSPVHVRRKRAADAQLVGSGLFLNECPWLLLVYLALKEILVELGPLNTGFDFDLAADAIELDDPRQAIHIKQSRIRRELLATHGMPAASHAYCSPIAAGRPNDGLHCIKRFGANDVMHSRRVQVRVDVIDGNAIGRQRRGMTRKAAGDSRRNSDLGGQLEKITS